MEKNIAHPTDAKLYHKARQRLVKWCEKENISLRQKYTHVSKKTLHNVSRYAHARQMKKGFALDVSALEGNPYDGHTLKAALEKSREKY